MNSKVQFIHTSQMAVLVLRVATLLLIYNQAYCLHVVPTALQESPQKGFH
jgi:hypothetical protein